METDPAKPASHSQLAGAGPGLVASVIGIVNFSIFACMCGHVEWPGLPGNLIAVSLAWWAALARKNDCPRAARFALLGCVIATTYMLLKNLADIGWNGHSPVFRSVDMRAVSSLGEAALVIGSIGLIVATVLSLSAEKA